MVTVVGIGPGNKKQLTVEAKEIIEKSKDILAFGRMEKSFRELNSKIRVVKTLEELKIKIKEDSVVLASGDPCFYGVVDYFKKNDIEIKNIITGISSMQYLMSKLKKTWHNVEFISLHGRSFESNSFKKESEYFILTDKTNTPKKISKMLYGQGYRGDIVIGENLSYEDERIYYRKIGDDIEESSLSVMFIRVNGD